jgi:hypothetical protein
MRQESTAEAVIEPFAIRMSIEMGEMILTEAGVWMEMPGLGWYQLGFTAAELTMSREQFMALEWGGDLDDLPNIPPWPSQILFMPDQASLPPGGRRANPGRPGQPEWHPLPAIQHCHRLQ